MVGEKVVDRSSVLINSIRFKLGGDGQIHPQLVNAFAPKQVIGDYSEDSDPERSVWVIVGDQRGGIGIEEMDETKDVGRSWWTDCNDRWRDHLFLPEAPSAAITAVGAYYPGYIKDTGLEIWNDATHLTNWTFAGTNGTLSQNTATPDSGTYAATITASGAGGGTLTQTLVSWHNDCRGVSVTVTARAKASGGGDSWTIRLDDGIGTTDSAANTSATYADMTVTRALNAGATKLDVILIFTTGGGGVAGSIDSISSNIPYSAAINHMVNFNTKLYLAAGNTLWRLNTAGTGFDYQLVCFTGAGRTANTGISALFTTVNSTLMILCGDTGQYYYTTDGITYTITTDTTHGINGDKGIHWGNMAFKISTAGQIEYTTTPNTATPTYTHNGLIDTKSLGTVTGLMTYANETGTNIIYAATTGGLFAHDYTHAEWDATELRVPISDDNGKGLVVQNGALYYSAGSSLLKFAISANGVTVENVSPNKDNGLPDEYNGVITKLIDGYGGEFYALVDTSLVAGTRYSSVLLHDAWGWHVIWSDGVANRAMGGGVISTDFAYRLWWSAGTSIYYAPLNRIKINPLKVTTTYSSAAGYHSPWFDANWSTGRKLALNVKTFCTGTAAGITVTTQYRLDHATTAIGSTWTTLDSIGAAGAGVITTSLFASGVGTLFNAIQFRYAFSTNNTAITPDIVYSVLEYERVAVPKWQYTMVLDCSRDYDNKTAGQLLDALVTAAETQTLVPFLFTTTTKYVRVKSVSEVRFTGLDTRGQIQVTLVEK